MFQQTISHSVVVQADCDKSTKTKKTRSITCPLSPIYHQTFVKHFFRYNFTIQTEMYDIRRLQGDVKAANNIIRVSSLDSNFLSLQNMN